MGEGEVAIVILHCSIKTGDTTHTVPLHYEVVDGHLEVVGGDGQSLDLGCTYYNTTVTSKVLLYNNSPASTEFIIILNNDSAVREEVRIIATFLTISLFSLHQGVDTSGTLALACTEGGLAQEKWREQGNAPPLSEMIKVCHLHMTDM